MTLQAILAEPSFMEILVAGGTGLRDPEECLAQVLGFDVGALGRRNLLGQVALVAGQSRMLAFEHIAGFLMIELVRIPLDEGKIRAIVVGVAADAFLARPGGNVIRTMQPTFRGHPRSNI